MDERDIEGRIRERAHRIWEEAGRPDGKDTEHWELARFAIAQADAQAGMLRRIEIPDSEPVLAVANQGEFPTLTDQGEQQNPGRFAD